MSSPSFYSQANNFISSVQGGVDPRTGLYNLSLPLVNLHSVKLAGPALSLSLRYSPLSSVSEGFGKGFALNLTRYDTGTGRLVLSTGEEYRVSSSGITVKQKKLKNFIFRKTDDNNCLVIHKSGLTEHLSLHKSVYVPVRITAPDGRGLTLTWSSAYTPARLARVTDDDGVVLFSVAYPDGAFATTKFSLLPYDGNAGYSIIFKFTNERLVRVTSHAAAPALVWTFDYDDVGPQKNYRVITGLTSPIGLKEKVVWYTDRGMKFPDFAGLPALPCVYQHTITPGGGQPRSITRWFWTQKNYLGRDAGLNHWQPDSDGMLNILLRDYRYGSTASLMDTNGSTVLSTVTRRYNSYHLQVSEVTLRGGKTYSQLTEYHAKSGVAFDKQPAQFALPVSHTESWDDGSGAIPRTRVTLTQFDEAGNPLRQEEADGTVTEYAYYPAEGEGDACPVDPHGFVRWQKSRTVTPPRIKGDEPVSETVSTWKKLGALGGDGYTVVAGTVMQSIGSVRTVITRAYYNDVSDPLTYAREKSRVTTLTPDVTKSISFTSRQDFTCQSAAHGLEQSETFTGHDGVTASRSTLRHTHTGLLLSETDAQNVTVRHTYDKTGRPLTRTVAAGTKYENTTTWSYAIAADGPVTTETDASGNQLRTYFDGAGRRIRQQRLDRDSTGKWFDVSKLQYNALGGVASEESNDWLTTTTSQKCTISMAASYDGWGEVSKQAFSDNTTTLQIIDPVGLRRSVYMTGSNRVESLSTGRVTVMYDARTHLPVTEIKTELTGQTDSERHRAWDGLGRLRVETDELGNQTERTYDAYDRVLTQTLPDGSIITRTYAPHLTSDSVACIKVTGPDKNGKIQTWLLGTQTFDSLGRVTEQVSGGRTTTWTYDDASALPSSVTLPSGNILAYRYIPELGNVVSSLTADNVTQVFSYDNSTGNLLTAKEGDTENTNTWTPSGALKSEIFSRGDVRCGASHSYTLSGGGVIYTDITGKSTWYERDSFGRVCTISDDMLTVSMHFDALSRLSAQRVTSTGTDMLDTALTYDDFGREISRTVTDSSGGTLIESRTWLKNGLLETKTTQCNGNLVRKEMYEYDVRNRLTGYIISGSNLPQDAYGLAMTMQAYRYDALNNLTTVTTTLADGSSDVATYHYENVSDPTQLSSVTHTHKRYPQTIVLSYDADGRMIRDEAGRTLCYDGAGRLVSVSGEVASGIYGYDALNRLVSQTVSDGDTRQLYYRAGELVNERMQQQGQVSRLIKKGHHCVGMSCGDALTLTAGDQHDSLLWSYDTSQSEGRQHVWSPYGSGNTTDLLQGFNGERADPVSGTYHLGNGYRAYNPTLMRFNCPDSLSPFGAGGINPYTYCAGDPVNHTDPSGHVSWQGGLGIVIGAVGLALSVFSAGASIAATGGVLAALSAASTTSLVVGGLGVAADVTAIASGAVEDSDPHASSVLGWVSMGLGLAGMVAGIRQLGLKSVISSANQRENVVLGGTMKNLDSLGQDLYLFDDTYKGAKRLNLVAHGALENDGIAHVARTSEKNMNANEIFSIINKRKSLQEYSNIRTIMCYSGNGGERAFGQRLAILTGIPVKSYRGTVTANFEVGALNKILLETAVQFGDDGLEHMRAVFGQRQNFEIRKTNPHTFFSLEHWKWNFDPIRFMP